MMFEDWLLTTRELQAKSYGTDVSTLRGAELSHYVRYNVLAAMHELLAEGLGEFDWKPWVDSELGFLNRDAFVNEMVDVLHFVANLLVAAGCSDEELSLRYKKKQQKNRERMASGGYEAVKPKCPHCGRNYDEETTKCRPANDTIQAWCAFAAWTQPAVAQTELDADSGAVPGDEWEDATLGSNVHVDDVVRVRDDAYTGVRGEQYNGKVFPVVSINYGHVELALGKNFTLHHPSKLQAKRSSRT